MNDRATGSANSGHKTTTDTVFERLHEEIMSLSLMPGTRISEAEVAARFGTSRQPVRDAFNRLEHIGFLNIRPQKATEVKLFSVQAIATSRIIREALEVEIVRRCHAKWSTHWKERLTRNLAQQASAMHTGVKLQFLVHDYAFHDLLCKAADVPFVADTIQQNRAQVDRLCLLSLTGGSDMSVLISDHTEIVTHMDDPDPTAAMDLMRRHLHRLDETISAIRESHGEYFES
jgi:DNA-binding GntR family transcriptional regulator